MRKMFSASGSARKAARKSAAVRRKNVHLEGAPDPAAMQNEIDYVARWALLHATTGVMEPAPIDRLLDLLPMFSRWVGHFEIDENPIVAAMRKLAAANNCRISPQDDSVEAAAIKNALSAWMKEHRFGDEWIQEAALCTLFCHADGVAAHRYWYLMPPYQQMNPELSFTLPRKGNESDEQYLKRFDEECRKRRKEFVKLVQFRKGARKGQLLPAKWTALVFVGKTFAEIARREKQQEDTVRKAIGAFSPTSETTPPQTTTLAYPSRYGVTLAGSGGNRVAFGAMMRQRQLCGTLWLLSGSIGTQARSAFSTLQAVGPEVCQRRGSA